MAFDSLSNVAGRCQSDRCQLTQITVKIQLIDASVSGNRITDVKVSNNK